MFAIRSPCERLNGLMVMAPGLRVLLSEAGKVLQASLVYDVGSVQGFRTGTFACE